MIKLSDFISEHTQLCAAELTGLTQPAISRIVNSDRNENVYVISDKLGRISMFEVVRIDKNEHDVPMPVLTVKKVKKL